MPIYSCQYDDDDDVDSLSELKLDQVLLPVDNLDNAKPVDLSDVASLEPSAKENKSEELQFLIRMMMSIQSCCR